MEKKPQANEVGYAILCRMVVSVKSVNFFLSAAWEWSMVGTGFKKKRNTEFKPP